MMTLSLPYGLVARSKTTLGRKTIEEYSIYPGSLTHPDDQDVIDIFAFDAVAPAGPAMVYERRVDPVSREGLGENLSKDTVLRYRMNQLGPRMEEDEFWRLTSDLMAADNARNVAVTAKDGSALGIRYELELDRRIAMLYSAGVRSAPGPWPYANGPEPALASVVGDGRAAFEAMLRAGRSRARAGEPHLRTLYDVIWEARFSDDYASRWVASQRKDWDGHKALPAPPAEELIAFASESSSVRLDPVNLRIPFLWYSVRCLVKSREATWERVYLIARFPHVSLAEVHARVRLGLTIDNEQIVEIETQVPHITQPWTVNLPVFEVVSIPKQNRDARMYYSSQ